MSTIEIHEFSTGIEVKGTQSAWESGGFTGEYMNRTLEKIPQAVLDSIANREFALAEGVVRAEPAIVGRVVRGYGESWSVVAVVTRGRDDRGRGVSLYRYFLCKDDGHIETILRWMDKPLLWVFNPFDYREVGQTHQANLNSKEVPLNKFQEMLDQSPPIVFPATENCVPLILNEITRQLRIPNSDRSWAYKVAMLERPEYFQVIYPVDPEAEKVIRETLDRRKSSSALISGESGIKTAIKAVMNNRVKRGHLENLENALGNPRLDENYWKSVLDKEGAFQAVRETIYGDRYVRLLTLRAMLVPQFLPIFLAWLADSKEWEIHYATSLKLQESMLQEAPKFTEKFPQLSEYLKWGICYTIDDLVDDPKILKQSQSLLTELGLWSQLYKKSLSKELESVLSFIDNKGQNWQSLKSKYPQWSNLLEKINKFWFLQGQHDPNYRNLTRLFEKVGTARLAAIFYQIGEGSVPKSLFDKLSTNKSELTIFKKTIYRRKNAGDYISDLGNYINSVFTEIVITSHSSPSVAIKKLVNDRVEWECLATLDDALRVPKKNQIFLDSLFNKVGAFGVLLFNKVGAFGVLENNSYSERVIKLLTLKAMLIPHFLPHFLGWLAESQESEKHYSVSQNLQEKILEKVPEFTKDFPKLSAQLKWGICIVIHSLVDDPQILEESKLFLTKPGLWSKVYQESLSRELENDINLMNFDMAKTRDLLSQAVQYPESQNLLRDLKKFLSSGEPPDPRYWILGNLFEALETVRLTTIFYKIGGDKAPKLIMPSKNPSEKAKKSRGIVGNCFYFFFCGTVYIGGIMPKIMFWILLMFVFTGGFALGKSKLLDKGITFIWSQIQSEDGKRDKGEKTKNATNSSRSDTNGQETSDTQISHSNLKNYKDTDVAINDIISKFNQAGELNNRNNLSQKIIDSRLTKPRDIVRYCVKDILKLDENFQYGDIGKNNNKWQEFSSAISKYQKSQRDLTADGIINSGQKTQTRLEQDIRNKCLKPQPNPPNPAQTRGIQ